MNSKMFKLMKLTLIVVFSFISFSSFAQEGAICGTVIDAKVKEPLIGATVVLEGTTVGVVTDLDGNFRIPKIKKGKYTIALSYVSYQKLVIKGVEVKEGEDVVLNVALKEDSQQLDQVVVVAKKNLENENVLLLERKTSALSVENIGAKEMRVKGISNVEEGVKKITGISIEGAGQLVVRGLGDRYSTTTLNGMPIASPNPDNKLIPLNLFPSSIVKNITVSKVYESSAFADYSGAHIDVATKENTGHDFFSVSLNIGGNSKTTFKDFYKGDRKGTLFSTHNLQDQYWKMSDDTKQYRTYIKENDVFGTDFTVDNMTSAPDFGGGLGFGKTFAFNTSKLSILGTVGASKESSTLLDAYNTILAVSGATRSKFYSNDFSEELKTTALASIDYSFRQADHITYTGFYTRQATSKFSKESGFHYDYEDETLISNNSVFHDYNLLNNQLIGHHEWNKFNLDWAGSYGKTGSYEPDRRQMIFRQLERNGQEVIKLNSDLVRGTQRYFAELNEDEYAFQVKGAYTFDETSKLTLGGAYKDKTRHYRSMFYTYDKIDDIVIKDLDKIYNVYEINQENIQNGSIDLDFKKPSFNAYNAGNKIYAGHADFEYKPFVSFLINVGVRYERSQQWVHYWTDGSIEKTRDYNTNDLFPALNLKFTPNDMNSVRLSLSKTVTRPSFVEMAPFSYQESYGQRKIRGNENLENGYNYNLDLRYEVYNKANDMLALTAYYKYLDNPIERIQMFSGDDAYDSFSNSKEGHAAGIEFELRKKLIHDFRLSANFSYMYTNVKLSEGSSAPERDRALQGASPYLGNFDLMYNPHFKNERSLSVGLLYNLQGERIHSVSVYEGLGDVKELTTNTLDFITSYAFNRKMSLSFEVKNLLNTQVRFEQRVDARNENVKVKGYSEGLDTKIGFTYKF